LGIAAELQTSGNNQLVVFQIKQSQCLRFQIKNPSIFSRLPTPTRLWLSQRVLGRPRFALADSAAYIVTEKMGTRLGHQFRGKSNMLPLYPEVLRQGKVQNPIIAAA